MTATLKWIVTLCTPFMLAAFITGIVINPWYPKWEYAKESFPPEPFGWTQAQRLELGTVAVDYLNAGGSAQDNIFMLGDQINPDNGGTLYTDNELSHMVDVKVRTDLIDRASWVLGIFVVGSITLLLYREETEKVGYLAIRNGGLATFGILIFFAAMVGIFWNWFFTTFHEIIFPQGNWQFPYSASLIRLFPDKFWFDVGVLIVGGTLLSGTIIAIIGHLLLRGAGLRKKRA